MGSVNLKGIVFMLAAMTVVPFSDAITKLLVGAYDPVQLTWIRYLVQVAVILPIVLVREGPPALKIANPVVQLGRGVFLVSAILFYVESLKTLPLPNAMATIFIYPFIVTVLSPVFLGEPVGIRRLSAVAVGFAGAMLVIKPGTGVFDIGSLYAVGSAVTYSGYALLTRKYSVSAPPLVMLLAPAAFGAFALSFPISGLWVPPTPLDFGLIVAVGLLTALVHFLIIMAYKHAEAAAVVPFAYFQIVMGTILGYALFGDFPTPVTWAGIAVIIASGVYISIREGVKRPGFRDVRRRP